MTNQQRSIPTDRQLNKAKRKVQKQLEKHLSLTNTEPRKLAAPHIPNNPYGVRSIRPLMASHPWEGWA